MQRPCIGRILADFSFSFRPDQLLSSRRECHATSTADVHYCYHSPAPRAAAYEELLVLATGPSGARQGIEGSTLHHHHTRSFRCISPFASRLLLLASRLSPLASRVFLLDSFAVCRQSQIQPPQTFPYDSPGKLRISPLSFLASPLPALNRSANLLLPATLDICR